MIGKVYTMKSKFSWIAALMLSLILGCTSVDSVDEPALVNVDASYALPLINTSASILDVEDATGDNSAIRIDPDGKINLLYNGDVIRRSSPEIFPPIPGSVIPPIELTDSITPVLQNLLQVFPGGFNLFKATYRNSSLRFILRSDLEEQINIHITIPELLKDGIAYETDIVINEMPPYGVDFTSEYSSIDGYSIITSSNELNVIYDARRANGERILLDYAEVEFDFIFFEYLEGSFPENENLESGNAITVGLYSNWISGGIFFEDPKITVEVENSFGFPVKGTFNKLEMTNVVGDVFAVLSPDIDSGFDFNYPELNEVGESKFTSFVFDKNNSNIQQIFNERIRSINYDIRAVGNPGSDPNIARFATDSSFYDVDIAVELPLNLRINELILTDSFDIDLSSYDYVDSGALKLNVENDFPFESFIQCYFINDNLETIDSLFLTDQALIPASITEEAIVQQSGSYSELIPITNSQYENLREASQIQILVRFSDPDGESAWYYDNFSLDLSLGAILNVKR